MPSPQLTVMSKIPRNKNLTLHPPQKSGTQVADGWGPQIRFKHGSTRHVNRGTPGGHSVEAMRGAVSFLPRKLGQF